MPQYRIALLDEADPEAKGTFVGNMVLQADAVADIEGLVEELEHYVESEIRLAQEREE